jgi:hypothetical protein
MSHWESFWSEVFPSDFLFWAAIWWLTLCGITAWLAHGKGQKPTRFFAIAFFFSPLLGLLAVMAARDLRSAAEAQMARDEFHELLGPLMLQIDGIRGHLAVSREQQRVSPPAAPAAPSRRDGAPSPSEKTAPRAAPALLGGASPS